MSLSASKFGSSFSRYRSASSTRSKSIRKSGSRSSRKSYSPRDFGATSAAFIPSQYSFGTPKTQSFPANYGYQFPGQKTVSHIQFTQRFSDIIVVKDEQGYDVPVRVSQDNRAIFIIPKGLPYFAQVDKKTGDLKVLSRGDKQKEIKDTTEQAAVTMKGLIFLAAGALQQIAGFVAPQVTGLALTGAQTGTDLQLRGPTGQPPVVANMQAINNPLLPQPGGPQSPTPILVGNVIPAQPNPGNNPFGNPMPTQTISPIPTATIDPRTPAVGPTPVQQENPEIDFSSLAMKTQLPSSPTPTQPLGVNINTETGLLRTSIPSNQMPSVPTETEGSPATAAKTGGYMDFPYDEDYLSY